MVRFLSWETVCLQDGLADAGVRPGDEEIHGRVGSGADLAGDGVGDDLGQLHVPDQTDGASTRGALPLDAAQAASDRDTS